MIEWRKDKKKYQNMNTHMNTSSKKPYRYKVYMNDQDTDKGEVGGSSPPRPTSLPAGFPLI